VPERPNRNVARGAATRDHLLAVATALFAERGYEETSIEAVLQEAGVSRGSLYHHFKGKDALFEAVLEALETEIGRRTIEAAATETTPAGELRAGCLAWIKLAQDPVVQRILLVDAPSVLGWDRWRALEERHALGLILAVVGAIAEEGGLDPSLVDIFSHVVMATMNEISLLLARSGGSEAAGAAVEEVLSRLLGA
jgi:AcrR family transcriptional regulator